MQSLFTAVIERSVAMSALILLYLAVSPWLERRYAAKWRYYAWLVIVLGLLIPFRPPFDVAVVQVNLPISPSALQPLFIGDAEPAAIQFDTNRQDSPAFPWYEWASRLWLAGAVAVMAYHALRHFRFLRMVGRWSEDVTDRELLHTLQTIKDELGIKQPVKLQTCHCVTVPMLIGFFRPVVLLPPTPTPSGELALILRHELVHVKRNDLWYRGLVLLASAVHWFNPAVYVMAKAIAVLCEISCDERVLKGATFQQRKLYGEAIIRAVQNGRTHATALSTNFYGGKKGMKTRIFSIMDTTKKRTGLSVLAVVLVATIGVGITFANGSSTEAADQPVQSAAEKAGTPQTSRDGMNQYAHFLTTVAGDPVTYYYNGRWVRSLYDEKPHEQPVLYFNAVADQDVAGKTAVYLKAVRNEETHEVERLEEMSEREVFQLMNGDRVVVRSIVPVRLSRTPEDVAQSAK